MDLFAGDMFVVSSTLAVGLRNVTLRSSNASTSAFDRPEIWANGTAWPMLLFHSVEAFALENIDFRGSGRGFNSTALFVKGTDAFSSIRMENASFQNFYSLLVYRQWMNATVCVTLPRSSSNVSTALAPNNVDVSFRNLLFSDNAADAIRVPFYLSRKRDNSNNDYDDRTSVRGSQISIELGNNTASSVAMRFEAIEIRNCSSNSLFGFIALHLNQHESTLTFDRVRVRNSTSATSGGVAIVRSPMIGANSTNMTNIIVHSCEFRDIIMPVDALGVFTAFMTGTANVTVTNSTFVNNVATSNETTSIASALFVSSGAISGIQPSTIAVTVADCVFKKNGRSHYLTVGGAAVLEYGDLCTDAHAVFLRSRFEDNHLCGECAAGPYFGGAIQVRANTYLSLQCRATRNETLLVDGCIFDSNSAARGGAIGTRNSCMNVKATTTIRFSKFSGNSALAGQLGFGGAIVNEQDESAIRIEAADIVRIQNCHFFSNTATNSGGAIALSRGVNVPMSSVVIFIDSSMVVANGALSGDQLWVALAAMVSITNSSILSIGAAASIVVLNTIANPFDPNGLSSTTISNSTIRCGPGSSMTVDNQSLALSDLGAMTQMTFMCRQCPPSSYNLFGEVRYYPSNTSMPFPSTFSCHDCPIGSRHNCSGGEVGASRGFWANPIRMRDENSTLQFHVCPSHYCCDETEGCAESDACSHNRTGLLCGDCKNGFTHAFAMHGACVPLDVCSPTQVWIGNSIVIVGCALFVIYSLLLRKSATSDGLVKVIVAFCNIAQVVIANSIALAPPGHGNADSAFSNGLRAMFAMISGLIQPQSSSISYCPMETLSSFEKLVVPLAVPALLLALWMLMSVALTVYKRVRRGGAVSANKSRRASSLLPRPNNDAWLDDPLAGDGVPAAIANVAVADDDDDDDTVDVVANRALEATRQLPAYRVFASLLTLLDFSLFIVVGVCVGLLNTVVVNIDPSISIAGQTVCRLWLAGDTPCSTGMTAGASVVLIVVLLAPIALQLWHRFRPQSILGVAVADVYQSAMAKHAPLYNFAITARRTLVAFANAFIVDNELRVVLIRTIILQSCMLHVFLGGPFASRWVNRAEAMALMSLLSVMLMQWTATSTTDEEMHTIVGIVQIVILSMTLAGLVVGVAAKLLQPTWRRLSVRRNAGTNLVRVPSSGEAAIVHLRL
jgi:hypothetical protein